MTKAKSKAKRPSSIGLIKGSKFKFNKSLVAGVALVVIVTGGYIFYTASQAAANPYDDARQSKLVDNPRTGQVYKGLRAVKKSANHPCRGIFEVEVDNPKPGDKPVCSHGPDPVEADVDISQVTAEQRLDQLDKIPKHTITTQQAATSSDDGIGTIQAQDFASGPMTNFWGLAPTPCVTSGKKIQLVITTNQVVTDATWRAMNSLKDTSHRLETELAKSSQLSGASPAIRQFRIATNNDCHPTVKLFGFNTSTDLSSIAAIRTALQRVRALPDSNTKYLIWNMTKNFPYCGISEVQIDSNPNQNNHNNNGGGLSVIGQGCWGSNAEMHELGHNLGAVQDDAPHTTGAAHCIDEHDVMCYPDNATQTAAANGKAVYIDSHCQEAYRAWLYDCRADDYFSSSFAHSVRSDNYLHNHWNISQSAFMQ